MRTVATASATRTPPGTAPAIQTSRLATLARRVRLDELPAQFDLVAHERREHPIRPDGVLDGDAQHAADFRVHGRLPELVRVHLTETLVALDVLTATAFLHEPGERVLEARDGLRFSPRSTRAPSSSRPSSCAQARTGAVFGGQEEVLGEAQQRTHAVLDDLDAGQPDVVFRIVLHVELVASGAFTVVLEVLRERRHPLAHGGLLQTRLVDSGERQHRARERLRVDPLQTLQVTHDGLVLVHQRLGPRR